MPYISSRVPRWRRRRRGVERFDTGRWNERECNLKEDPRKSHRIRVNRTPWTEFGGNGCGLKFEFRFVGCEQNTESADESVLLSNLWSPSVALLVIDTSLNGNQGQTVLGQREGRGQFHNTQRTLEALRVEKQHTLTTHYREIQRTSRRARLVSNA